jgi:hypothetical protein
MRNLGLSVVLMLAACPGKAPPDQNNNPDAPVVDPDGSVPTTSVTLSGKVMDYFTGAALDTTALTTDGLVPPAATVSAADGTYSLDVAVGSKLFAQASRTNYLVTRSAVITVADMPLTQDVYVASASDVNRQFASVGVTKTTGTIIAAEIQKNNGTPYEGLALTAFTLTDTGGTPVAGINGPFNFGALGDLDAAVTTTTAYGTPLRVRIAFLNIPAGTFNLNTAFIDGMGNPKVNTTTVVVDAGGATLALNGGLTGGAAAGPPPTDPTFAVDIYPRLQTAAKGGLGCANCHTANGPTGAKDLPYDDTPATVLAAINAKGVITTATPATSLFLTMPLYEVAPPQNHPNATFLDVNDRDYKMFLLWITNGAKP